MKQIPYGIDDFDRIIRENYYYIDKSRYIKVMEDQSSYILFVRPRRMGKSLFINMMMSYYDLGKKDKFHELFGQLWIGKNPTAEANKYLVLKFDFSQVGYNPENLEERFRKYCFIMIEDFLDRYKSIFNEGECARILSKDNVKDAINTIIAITKIKDIKTYLFIDEYDNFSNTVLAARGVEAHRHITHGEGFYRDFFKCCKGTFTRVYLSGVTPVTYDDLTSGFNIADVVALKPQFEKVVGVTETELRALIEYYQDAGKITQCADDIVAQMKPWYNNFCFCNTCFGAEPPIYNTDMVMRYMKELVTTGCPPKEMVDHNAMTDYQKLNYLVMTEDLDNREMRMNIIRDICAHGYTTGYVHEQFPASRCGDETNFKSMLYYFGTITFGGWDEEGETILKVPNKTMGELYLQYMLHTAQEEGWNINNKVIVKLHKLIGDAAIKHEWEPLVQEIGLIYRDYSGIRNTIRGESDIQGFMRGLLCLNRYFAIWPELELGSGFCDILLVPKSIPRCPTRYSYLIELKYMKKSETDLSKYKEEALCQLNRYATDNRLTESNLLKDTSLAKLYMIFQGQKLIDYGIID